MMGMRSLFGLVIVWVALFSGGCRSSETPQKKNGHGESQPANDTAKKDPGIVGVVRKTGFGVNKSQPVGKALDDYRYITKRTWQETDVKNGTIYVDFIGELDLEKSAGGLLKDGVVASSINIKFVVKTNGNCFVGMITRYDTKADGKTYPVYMQDIAGIMSAIYANKELPQQ